jgi:hypothetical protein
MPAAITRLLQLGLVMASTAAGAGEAVSTGLQSDVVFTDNAELARGAELARRSLSPLTALRLKSQITAGDVVDLRTSARASLSRRGSAISSVIET